MNASRIDMDGTRAVTSTNESPESIRNVTFEAPPGSRNRSLVELVGSTLNRSYTVTSDLGYHGSVHATYGETVI